MAFSPINDMRRIQRELEALENKAKLTAADEARLDELTRAFDRSSTLHRLSQHAAGHGSGDLRTEHGTHHYDPDGAAPTRTTNGPLAALRDQAMRNVDTAARSGELPDHGAQRVEKLLRDGPAYAQTVAARWAIATGDPAYARAFATLVADPTRGHLLWEPQEQEAYRRVAHFQSEMRQMEIGTGAGGGHMVPMHLDPAIILTSDGSNNPLREISRVVQVASSEWNGVSSAGVTAEWKSEHAEVADASPTLEQPNIPVHFGDAFVPFSFEVGMDAVNFMQELQRLLVDGLAQLHATAFTTGSGTGQPTGIVTALTGTSSEVDTATAATLAAEDVFATQSALPARFSMNAQWAANIAVINHLSQEETANGSKVFPGIADDRLLRKPLNELSNMSGDHETAGEKVLLYGDFSNFVIVDRIGAQLELIPNLVGANQRPTGQRGALLWARTGADSVNDSAFVLLNVSA
ncbi:phage major capsid protein [Allosalinactinospora lopnorensis]|uniref:phage major capsid protein n=1 Tax=Allosalinactinospora lopnorensis TaxID=1352348 RepID=UPI000697A02E|nr:phage major capsid protein [Allosalinactinospora lopnorensis]